MSDVAAEILDALPAHRTLGLRVLRAAESEGRVVMAVKPPTHNVVGALHSSGITALIDAAGLAEIIAEAPNAADARRLQPLGTAASIRFHRPVRELAVATCRLDRASVVALSQLYRGVLQRLELTTRATVSGDREPIAAWGEFTWSIRLRPASTAYRR